MSTLIIPSLLNPESHAFEVSGDLWNAWYDNRWSALARGVGHYSTYGDGLVKHSPTCICHIDHFTDFCLSFASYQLEHPDEEYSGHYIGGAHVRRDTVEFLKTVIHSDEKPRYFSRGEMKVSSAPSKRFDTRWVKVPEWADGTMASVIDLYWHTDKLSDAPNCSVIERYWTIKTIEEIMVELEPGRYHHMKPSWEDWFNKFPEGHAQAFRAFRETHVSTRNRQQARVALKNAMQCVKPQAQVA